MLASSTLAAGLLLSAWAATGPGPTAQGATPAQDPAASARFAQQIATHPYFSRIALERVDSQPPFTFLIQKTAGGEAARAGGLAERYAELLAPTLELFRQELAGPRLVQNADRRFVVAVLASPGDLENFQRVMSAPSHLEAQGAYDRTLNAAVLCEDPFQRLRSVREQAHSARHLFAHVCEAAWYSGEGHAPLDSWVMEGLALELSRREEDEERAPDAEDLRAFLHDLADERRSWTHARTIDELCEVFEPEGLEAFLEAHSATNGEPPDDLESVRSAFHRQSALLLHFLLEGEERRHRAACLAFLQQAFAGRARDGLAASFQPTTTAALDDAFVAWAVRTYRAAAPRDELDTAKIEKALRRGASSEPSSTGPSPAAAPARAAEPAPAPALTVPGLALDLASTSADERFALALYELARGRARAGLAALDDLAREAPAAVLRERVERERRRVLAWIELRDEFLRERLESGELIEFTYKGNKLKSMVLGYADGVLALEKSRAPESLSVEAIDPLELAQQIKASGGPNDWARIYPYVLRDDPRAKKLLRDDGGEGGAMLADLPDYPERVRLGSVQGRLGDIATRKPPTTLKEVRAQLEELAAWRRDAEALPILERKREAVQEHARTLLGRELELLPPEGLLRGKLELREGDAVRLTYEFDDASELSDFTSDPYPRGARRALGAESSADTPFQVQGGALTAQGQASLRSLIELAAPLTVRYTLKFDEPTVPNPRLSCALGICDDGREHFVWAIDTGHLQRSEESGTDQAHDDDVMVLPATAYALELRHDGTNVVLYRGGQEQRSIGAGARKSGAFFLCTASDGVLRIERIQIEGRLAPNAFERVKRTWIMRGLERF